MADVNTMLKIRDSDSDTRLKIFKTLTPAKITTLSATFWALDTVDLEQVRHSLFIEFTTYLPQIKLTELESILHIDK